MKVASSLYPLVEEESSAPRGDAFDLKTRNGGTLSPQPHSAVISSGASFIICHIKIAKLHFTRDCFVLSGAGFTSAGTKGILTSLSDDKNFFGSPVRFILLCRK
jgi:hypothetical protein